MDFFIFAQQNPNMYPPPDIQNGYQFVYMILPIIFTFIISIVTMVMGYINGQKISQVSTALAVNTTKTDVIHDIVRDAQAIAQANQVVQASQSAKG